MNCEQVRLHIGGEPASLPREVEEHVEHCDACRAFLEETLRLDAGIRRAFDLDPAKLPKTPAASAGAAMTQAGAARPDNVVPFERRAMDEPRPRSTPRRWALAASLVVALGVGAALWTSRPTNSLAAEVVAHMAEEPFSWSRADRLPQDAIDAVLRHGGVALDAGSTDVVYANACEFRGRAVPHLVVSTAEGPVTVIVLRGERVKSAVRFEEGGYSGVLVPAARGSLAVLVQGTAPPSRLDDVSRRLQAAIRWLD